jgi:ribosomal protein S18 acetylase RimI-like enzyme
MIEIAMQRDNLNVESASFEPFYQLRTFQPGDDKAWFNLQQATGIYPALESGLFYREFNRLPIDRQFFIIHEQKPIATGTAWYGEPLRTQSWGRLHWIAVHPAYQRQGIGLNLCRHLMRVLQELGCLGAFLTTGSENEPAISLYRKLRFIPWIRTAEEASFWQSYKV